MVNFFKIFNIKTSFVIDNEQLDKIYIDFQGKFHPDKSSIDEIEKSIQVNEGYKVLSDDFLRACHLLALKGFDILNNEKVVKIKQQILLEILELQENISEIGDLKKLAELEFYLKAEIKTDIAKFVEFYNQDQFEDSAQQLIRVKYLKKSLKDLKDKKKEIKNGN